MSEFMKRLREKADALVAPHVNVYGEDAPVVRFSVLLLAAAEDVEREIQESSVRTSVAAEQSGWSAETLQKYARMKLAGEDLPHEWSGLEVTKDATGFLFVLGSIPQHAKAA